MPDEDAIGTRTRASNLVSDALDRLGNAEHEGTPEGIGGGAAPARSDRPLVHLSESQLGTLLDAVEQDLRQPCGNGRFAKDRQAIVDARTRVLAEAVIAIETDQNFARTARLLNAEPEETDGPSVSADIAAAPAKAI